MTAPSDDRHKPTQEFREYVVRDLTRAMRHNARFAPPVRGRAPLRAAVTWAIAAFVALAAGVAIGTSTGYASGVANADRNIDDLSANARYAAQQFASVRRGIAQTRSDISSLGTATRSLPSLQKAESELAALETAVRRIEQDVAANAGVRAASGPSVPMKRALSLACATIGATGQHAPAVSQQRPIPVVDLAPATVATKTTFSSVMSVRQLGADRVFVNDGRSRTILLFDSTLTKSAIVFDSIEGSAKNYGSPWAASLIPYIGDSLLFAHFNSQTLLVIDSRGNVARTMAPPSPGSPAQGGSSLINAFIATDDARVDARGRIIYKDSPGTMMVRAVDPDGVRRERVVEPPDSAAILRADLDTRRVDTIGRVMQPSTTRMSTVPGPDGRGTVMKVTVNPVQAIDEFAVLSDGTVALVRGHDYHIDWIRPDGTRRSTDKLPFDWKRISDEEKQRMIDSARAEYDRQRALAAARRAAAPPPAADMGSSRGNARGSTGDPGRGGGGRGEILTDFAPLSELADYYPAIRRAAARGDADGNLWVLPTTSAQSKNGELVYDVINPNEGLFERVRIPAGRSVAGFGKGGVVYLIAGSLATGFTVERTRLPQRR